MLMLLNRELARFKDKHKGKRMFIIGNGPSLNQTDLGLLCDDISFGMNRISLIYPTTTWRPTYYIYCSTNVMSKFWGKAWIKDVCEASQEKQTTCFIWRRFQSVLQYYGRLSNDVVWLDSMTENGVGSGKTFSVDIVQSIDKSGSTMIVPFQIAAYMGISQIFILGSDLGWKKAVKQKVDPNHFDSTYIAGINNGAWWDAHMRKTHLDAYESMKKLEIEVYNASISTLLDVYPLVDYEEVARNPDWQGNGRDSESKNIQEKRKRIADYWKQNKYIDRYRKGDRRI